MNNPSPQVIDSDYSRGCLSKLLDEHVAQNYAHVTRVLMALGALHKQAKHNILLTRARVIAIPILRAVPDTLVRRDTENK